MRIVALMTIRNEALYLARTLKHLYSQGVETCVIDNGSTDSSREIVQSFLGKGVFRIESLPYKEAFELLTILQNEERLAREIEADWFLHHDADEIREAPAPFTTLKEGIEEADRLGYNAVNFEDFVFVPTSDTEAYEGTDFVKEMRYYYLFAPRPLHRVNAWKKTSALIDLGGFAGHQVEFEGRKIFPTNFILRHYMFLSKAHAIEKYTKRTYSTSEVQKLGWHGFRPNFKSHHLKLPGKKKLHQLQENGIWNKTDPLIKHQFIGNSVITTLALKIKKMIGKSI
jgi:glycosyltransferase involved in cell wall biosynthesis